MGFINPSPSPVEPSEFVTLPLRERIRILSTDWADHGFGAPRVLHVIYIVKMLGLYLAGGIFIASLTSDIVFTDISSWWDNIVIYQKLAVWLMLLEVIGLAGTWGPLCGNFKPMTGGFRYWIRPGTIRMAPWGDRVPFTGGDSRTIADVALYVVVLVSLLVPLLAQAEEVAGFPDQQVIPGWAFVPILIVMPLMGLRDKVIFLAGRSEQYLPIMLYSLLLSGNFVDLIIAFKVVIISVWIGAGVSKFGDHFVHVVPPMVSNSPAMPGKFIKRLHYRDAPHDLLPSRFAWFMAHVGGTTVEILIPLVLLFTTNVTVAALGALAMLLFHIFITSTFPLAVPLEWNVFFGLVAVHLFIGHDPGVFALGNFSNPWGLVLIFALAMFFPVLGNVRPDLVSFLPAMRQYAGNWATGLWAMKPGVEERLNELPGVTNQIDQLQAMPLMGYSHDEAEMTLQKSLAWRSMHSQGRGHFSLMMKHLDDLDSRTVRDGELVGNAILGFNFGDGHMHDERLVAAVQKRLHLAPGDLVITFAESSAIHRKTQDYRVIDAALGVVERGTWVVADCVDEQPWLPDGPVALHVIWTADGFVPGVTLTRHQGQGV